MFDAGVQTNVYKLFLSFDNIMIWHQIAWVLCVCRAAVQM